MSIFKKGIDVLDFTELQKRGLLKVPEKKAEDNVTVNSEGYAVLGSPSASASGSSAESGAGALGFLDALAGVGTSSGNTSSSVDATELQGLKNKIDDLEYKLDRLMEKIAKMENGTSLL
jgi:hypothetical protein